MKKKILALGVSTSIACSNAFAAINLGQGNIGSGNPNTYPSKATLSINALTENVVYYVVCNINALNANKYPVILRFDIPSIPVRIMMDGHKLTTKQMRIEDCKTHVTSFHDVIRTKDASVELSWLASDGVNDPVHYECYAEPDYGLNKG